MPTDAIFQEEYISMIFLEFSSLPGFSLTYLRLFLLFSFDFSRTFYALNPTIQHFSIGLL